MSWMNINLGYLLMNAGIEIKAFAQSIFARIEKT